ncbi:hypothetical protein [Olivibacter sitiensis]|uniref:hypothetical protein n=1 Tax=Olivibacter sitiensis TaxID=376470 RepID=UPI0003F4C9BA|nr:hypothetical protein [Olivibacter sitiensis]
MKKQLITLAILLCTSLSVWAQKEYKLAKNTGKLILNLNGATIEGYDGKEIVFIDEKAKNEVEDERARGLRAISGSGIIDNTGLGINVTESGQDVKVNLVGNGREDNIFKILVPSQMDISFAYENAMFGRPITIQDMKGEIEVSVRYNEIKLVNNSGPMNIKSMHGGIDASFEEPIKGPISMISVYNHVDVSLPTTTKANVELGTSYGKLYAADDFKIAVLPEDKAAKEKNATNAVAISGSGTYSNTSRALTVINRKVNNSDSTNTASAPITVVNGEIVNLKDNPYFTIIKTGDNIKGTINGGGLDLILKSNHNNVYLRTPKN